MTGLPGEHLRVAGPDWVLRRAGVGLAVAAMWTRHPHRQHRHARGTISISINQDSVNPLRLVLEVGGTWNSGKSGPK